MEHGKSGKDADKVTASRRWVPRYSGNSARTRRCYRNRQQISERGSHDPRVRISQPCSEILASERGRRARKLPHGSRTKDTDRDFSRWQLDDTRQTPRTRNRPNEGETERKRTAGDRRKREEKRGEQRGEEKEDEIWAVLEGGSAYPIGYASVTATFTMSGYTRPRTTLGRTFSYTCIQIVPASTITSEPASRDSDSMHSFAAARRSSTAFRVPTSLPTPSGNQTFDSERTLSTGRTASPSSALNH